MELLRWVTLVYVGVLVLALAVGLITIWIYLRRVAHALAGARDALRAAERETAVLPQHLAPLRDLTAETAAELSAADGWLAEADARLATLAERLGLAARLH